MLSIWSLCCSSDGGGGGGVVLLLVASLAACSSMMVQCSPDEPAAVVMESSNGVTLESSGDAGSLKGLLPNSFEDEEEVNYREWCVYIILIS